MKRKLNSLFIVIPICLFIVFAYGHNINAGIYYPTQVPDLAGPSVTFGSNTRPLGEYIKKVYDYGVGITAIIATVVLMIGGFQWIIAGGSGEKIGEAKAWVTAALSGLILALSSYMILNLVNPDLINFTVKEIIVIKPIEKANPLAKKVCKEVLGDGWVTKDGNFCTGGATDPDYSECKTTKITDTNTDCCCKEKVSPTFTEFHKECKGRLGLNAGDPTLYSCQLVSSGFSSPSTCSADAQCNATNSTFE